MTRLTHWLPTTPQLHLDAWHIDDLTTQLTWQVTSTQVLVHGPLCRFPTRRVHRRSIRTVADLPWGSWRVVLHLQVRKCFCANGRCTRRMFTARLLPLVAPWARRTQRLAHWLVRLAGELAGTAGARLSRGLGLGVSRNTLLRLLRRLPLPDCATPPVLGVDDWAVRNGQTSGTVLSDLERRRALALLPDREAKTVALWLPAHPGVRVIVRDRSRTYADGARPGAPDAIQVADRVHLVQNLAEALDQVFHAQSHALEAVHEALRQAPVTPPDGMVAVPVPPPSPPRKAQERAYPRQARRLALHQQIGAFHQQGWPAGAMAQPLGMGKNTVFRSLRTETLPARKRRTDRGRRLLTPYMAYLLDRWNAGCRDAWRLFHKLQPRGDHGSYVPVARVAQRLRHAHGEAPRPPRPRPPRPLVTAPPHRAWTPRRAPWLVRRRAEQRTPAEQELLTQLTAQDAELAGASALAHDCAQLGRQRQPAQLDPWLARAAASPLGPRQRWANGRRDDYDAVKAGVSLPWSTGPVEGPINRLKTLKRQMCGRASLDRLQRRFVLAA